MSARPALALVVLLAGCDTVERPCRFSFAAVELSSREAGEVRFGVRDAHGVTVTLEGTLTLEMREHHGAADDGSGRVLCSASVLLPRSAYRGDPLEASAALHFAPACERAAQGTQPRATLTLTEADGHTVRWAGLGGPFTAWLEPVVE